MGFATAFPTTLKIKVNNARSVIPPAWNAHHSKIPVALIVSRIKSDTSTRIDASVRMEHMIAPPEFVKVFCSLYLKPVITLAKRVLGALNLIAYCVTQIFSGF
jgi:hypothetical protein